MFRPQTVVLLACLLRGTLFATEASSRNLTVRLDTEFERDTRTETQFVRMPLPVSEPGVQTIRHLTFTPRPNRILKDKDRRVAEWHLPSGTTTKLLRVEAEVELHVNQQQRVTHLSRTERKKYLSATDLIQTGHAELQKWADSIQPGTTDEETLRRLMHAVSEALPYQGYEPEDQGALAALQQGGGDCTEYTDLLVALCRIKGLPARNRLCIKIPSREISLHSVTQVYLHDQGWVTMDPLWADQARQKNPLETPNQYLFYSVVRDDPLMKGFFSYIALRNRGGPPPSRITTRIQIAEKTSEGPVKTSEYSFSEDWSDKEMK